MKASDWKNAVIRLSTMAVTAVAAVAEVSERFGA